jgi:hypothetical protein
MRTLVLLLASCACLGAAPAPWDAQAGASVAGTRPLETNGASRSSSDSQASASIDLRSALPYAHWYWTWGAEADQYTFSGSGPWPGRLLAIEAPLKLQYFDGDQQEAEVSLSPGLYYAGHATASAFDMPVQAVSGIPITGAWNGVVGVSNGRFYHHALPILGIVWDSGPVHAEIVYPQTQVTYRFSQRQALRAGGELSGNGFRDNRAGLGTPVEYSCYRLGAWWDAKGDGGLKSSLGAGIEVIRNLDYFARNTRVHGGGGFFLELQLEAPGRP